MADPQVTGGGEVFRGEPEVKDAKGPTYDTDAYHSFCPTCNRVTYSLTRYGPMTPAEHNRFFCVCNGKMTGIVKQRHIIYDVEDVDPKAAAEMKKRGK